MTRGADAEFGAECRNDALSIYLESSSWCKMHANSAKVPVVALTVRASVHSARRLQRESLIRGDHVPSATAAAFVLDATETRLKASVNCSTHRRRLKGSASRPLSEHRGLSGRKSDALQPAYHA
jgi:hypothetical protein